MEVLSTHTELADGVLIRSSGRCQAIAGQLLDGPVQQLSALALEVSAAAAATSAGSAQHWLHARAEVIGRYARLLATAADKLERVDEAPVHRPRGR